MSYPKQEGGVNVRLIDVDYFYHLLILLQLICIITKYTLHVLYNYEHFLSFSSVISCINVYMLYI